MSASSNQTTSRTTSSRTPNDILLHSAKCGTIPAKPSSITHLIASRPTSKSIKMKKIFVNGKQQEELMSACSEGDLEKVARLLGDTKPPLNPDKIRDTKLRSPLLIACASGRADLVRLLVKYGADVNNPVGDIIGNRPLDLAVVSNDVDTVLALLDLGAKIHRPSACAREQDRFMNDNGSKCPLPPIPHRLSSRSPLDLAQSRLNLLAQYQRSGEDQEKLNDFKAYVIKIIQLLRHFAKPTPTVASTNTTSAARLNTDPGQELDYLTARLSSIGIRKDEETDLIKDLGDVISKMQL